MPGGVLPDRLKVPLELAEVVPGMSVLDVGCGRGEILLHAARVVGFDYAVSAMEITAEFLNTQTDVGQILIHLGNAQRLPYLDKSFDRVFMLDVVEHLYPTELHRALTEIRRVLRPGGKLIIHTMPNTWYYRFGYPMFRLAQRPRGKHLPADPRDRWKSIHEMHVNEQNLILLRRELRTCKRISSEFPRLIVLLLRRMAIPKSEVISLQLLRAAGFKAKVYLRSVQSYAEEPIKRVRLVMRVLVTLYPFRWVFCNDLFAVAVK